MIPDARPIDEPHGQHVQQVPAGTLIVKENEVSQKMFIIKKGRARVFKLYLGQRITLAVLSDGEIFGEMSFIDAQPRSASVEALTDMELIVVDGAKGAAGLESLPPWVWTIFKTVFYRFRKLDGEITALHTALNYRKKGLKQDVAASTIYLELIRFIKTVLLVYNQQRQCQKSLKPADVFAEVDSILGNRTLGLRQFWNLMQEFDIFDPSAWLTHDTVNIVESRINGLDGYLKEETRRERYLMLSHGALSVIRHIIQYLDRRIEHDKARELPISCADLRMDGIANLGDALKELEENQIIPFRDKTFFVNVDRVHELYVYHSIIKRFDHSAIYVD